MSAADLVARTLGRICGELEPAPADATAAEVRARLRDRSSSTLNASSEAVMTEPVAEAEPCRSASCLAATG